MTKADKNALKRAMELAKQDPGRARQLAEMLIDESWRSVAEFASFCCQIETLRLKPWEPPPCCASSENSGAWRLLQRMLEAGVSRYEPDPLKKLEEKTHGSE